MNATRLLPLLGLALSTSAIAADLLPLKNGIYVPVGRVCKGASNAEMVNYWGGRSGIGVAQATCTIASIRKKGSVYTYRDKCTDIQSGDEIAGGPTVVTIQSATAFRMGGTAYRYCGPKVQF